MGVVYKARQVKLNRVVALKMILAGHLATEEEVRRFYLEAEAAAQLEHPGIVPIFEVGEHAGRHFFSMSFVEGGSLAQRVQDGPLHPAEAAELVERIADAVAYAHGRGIVHRDLKPGNILLDRDGNPKVTDFGLAKKVAGDSNLTLAGQIMGTPSYMAPEQAAGQTDAVGPAADVYALGAILYCLLTGRPPFDSVDVVETLRQVREQEPVPPRRLNLAVRRDLDTVCLKCLQKDPRKRYASAAALADDLRRFRTGRPILARPVGRVERVWRWCRRNPVEAFLFSAVAASLVLGMATTSYYAHQAGVREQEALDHARRAEEEQDRNYRRWYAAEMNLAQKAWEEAYITVARRRLDALRPKPPAADLRGFEWYCLRRLCGLELHSLPIAEGPAWCVAFSPDGRLLAAGSGRKGEPGQVKVWDLKTRQEIFCLRGHPEFVSCLTFSPDGRRLATGNGGVRTPGEVKIWNVSDGRELFSLPRQKYPVWDLAFTPDGDRLAVASAGVDARGRVLPTEVQVWDLAARREILCLHGQAAVASAVAFSPDGRRLAYTDDRAVQVCNAGTGQGILTLSGHANLVSGVAFSPKGERLATGSVDGTVAVWEAASGKRLLTLRHTDRILNVAFSRDGRHLAAAAGDRVVQVWDTRSVQEPFTLRGHEDSVSAVAFSPDGWRLASAGQDGAAKLWDATGPPEALPLGGTDYGSVKGVAYGPDGRRLALAASDATLHVWDLATALEIRALRGHVGSLLCVAHSPDAKWLASGGHDRTVRVWDANTGAEVRCLRGHPAAVRSVAFSPAGRLLASGSVPPLRDGKPQPSEVKIWDLDLGQEVRTLPADAAPTSDTGFTPVAFSPDGAWLAIGAGPDVRVCEVATGRQLLALGGGPGAVADVAYSPDGRRLAAARQGGTVQVWDTATGQELLQLVGHTGGVYSVSFSPDGNRLASASGGVNRGGVRLPGELKIWDMLTGQEILTLQGGEAQAPSLAYSPDGRRLAVSGDRDVLIWEGAATASDTLREARSWVRFLGTQGLSRDAVQARIREDATVDDGVRQQALLLVEPFWQSRVHREAEDVVRSLFRTPLFRPEVVAQVQADPALSEPVRRKALALAEHHVEDPIAFDRASRGVVRRPGAAPAAYRRARDQAELACRLLPFVGAYHTTLGMAQFRLGQYAEALTTLTRADELNRMAQGSSVPADLALLAMTRWHLKANGRAREDLERLRATLREPKWSRNEEAQSLLKEAEALLGRPAE
jgi:WD40 repeat protein/tRNA A-37 threonylcarbamoyl transferase component Bud32